jgi:hypothetical protein
VDEESHHSRQMVSERAVLPVKVSRGICVETPLPVGYTACRYGVSYREGVCVCV